MKMTMESENGLLPIFEGKVLKIGIRIFGIFPSSFLSEITEIKPLEYFIDTQLTGPFAYWQHKHLLIKTETGVKIHDQISLKFPLGWIGQMAYHIFGKSHLQGVFEYRKKVLEEKFGKAI